AARWLRRADPVCRSMSGAPLALDAGPRFGPWRFWSGLVLLMAASCSLEWTRLYKHELSMAGEHAGGIVGLVLGSLSSKWLGFNGSRGFWIAMLVAATSMSLRLPWL